MFKRSTKLTALLVAAASVASTVPAMAATKLATKDGTIENAVAFKDGKYLYEGYRTDDNEKGLYLNKGEQDKQLDDADELGVKFNDKYVSAFDGSDEYVIDLSNGTITDDDTLTDLNETAQTKLVNKLKKTDRYGSSFDDMSSTVADRITNFSAVTNGSFEDVWYQYEATTPGGATTFGYTNASGTYIDCSFDLNVYAYQRGKMYKIEDVEDTTVADDGTALSISSVTFDRYLGQDDKYIYSLIKVAINNAQDIKGTTSYDEVNSGTRYFVQKVSKNQGDKKDDAYKPKSTECFEVTENFDNGDCADAYDALIKKYNISVHNIATGGIRYETKAIDGVIYVTYQDGEKVKTIKVPLKTSEKLKTKGSNSAVDKVSGRVARKDGDKDTKAEDWTLDVDGNVWAIYNGEIKKSTKIGDFEKVYTCDRSLDCLDVYDENNLIAWDSEGDVYTTVGEGSKAAEEEAKEIVGETATTEPAVTAKTGWDQLADGTWNLYDATGKKVTGWANVGGVWYYMDPTTAVMKTGWLNDNGTWYYLQASGAMKTGWLNDNGTWYYLKSNGAMATGWLQDTDGQWYYLNDSGAMLANTTVDGYVLGANGAWIR